MRGSGASFLMEHPDTPTTAHLPSTWKLPESAALKGFKGQGKCRHVASIRLDQCTCGAPTKKATRLFAINLEPVEDLIGLLPNRGRCPHFSHREVLQGLAAEGGFRTAAAKQYPPKMCELIANAFMAAVYPGSLPISGLPEPASELACFFVPLDPYFEGHGWGRFAPDLAS